MTPRLLRRSFHRALDHAWYELGRAAGEVFLANVLDRAAVRRLEASAAALRAACGWPT